MNVLIKLLITVLGMVVILICLLARQIAEEFGIFLGAVPMMLVFLLIYWVATKVYRMWRPSKGKDNGA